MSEGSLQGLLERIQNDVPILGPAVRHVYVPSPSPARARDALYLCAGSVWGRRQRLVMERLLWLLPCGPGEFQLPRHPHPHPGGSPHPDALSWAVTAWPPAK